MNILESFFDNRLIQALGWTLIHSLWQSLLVLLFCSIVRLLIPARLSGIRYAVSLSGLGLILVFSIVTCLRLLTASDQATPMLLITETNEEIVADAVLPVTDTASRVVATVRDLLPPFVAGWFLGFLFLTSRLVMGLKQVSVLRKEATIIDGRWAIRIRELSAQLGILRFVTLAESSRITSPIVIGVLKPMILVPTGMLTGLSTEQLETIFLHELAHIRRYDYLANVVQSLMECIFFFNPFMWMLSGIVRREREYCCDDFVLKHHSSRRAYARALTRLAEIRLARQALGVALGDDKHELLNRIKRIMERPVKPLARTRWILPAVVLTISLACISWMGMQSPEVTTDEEPMVEADTVPDKREQRAVYSRQRILTYDENGEPHEEIVENFEGDESLRPLLEESIPGPSMWMTPPMPPAPMLADTIPPAAREDWQAMTQRMREHMKMQMEHLRQQMRSFEQQRSDLGIWHDSSRQFMRGWFFSDSTAFFPDEEVFANLQRELQRFRKEFNEQSLHLDDLRKELNRGFKPTRPYEEALRDELVRDGYLRAGESIESLEWNNKTFRVNGKTIRKEHLEKYRDLQSDYFGRRQ